MGCPLGRSEVEAGGKSEEMRPEEGEFIQFAGSRGCSAERGAEVGGAKSAELMPSMPSG